MPRRVHVVISAASRTRSDPPRLGELLDQNALQDPKPFGRAQTHALTNARIRDDGLAVWEGEEWARIARLPRLLQPRVGACKAARMSLATTRTRLSSMEWIPVLLTPSGTSMSILNFCTRPSSPAP